MINGPVWNEDILKNEVVAPTILAIGDSWFWYLKNNLVIPLHKILNKRKNHVILVRGANGANASEFQSGPIRKQIEFDLDKKIGYGSNIKSVFLSGGGNDLAGPDDFAKILLKDCSIATTPTQCLKEGQPKNLFNKVTHALISVIDLVEKNIPGTPVFVHSYDYANPNGKGFLGLGQWLQYPMNECKVPPKLHQPLVNHLIDSYWEALVSAQKTIPTLNLIDQRGTLERDDWANELHPVPSGFNRLAKLWEPILRAKDIA